MCLHVTTAVSDDEVDVWVATSEDVPGLVTEAPSLNELMAKLKLMIPELLDDTWTKLRALFDGAAG